jgi:1-acyl-sn-glycerol-3-phosphate acyltransferase
MLTNDQLDIFSIAACIALLAASAFAIYRYMRRHRLTLAHVGLYFLACFFVYGLWKMRVRGHLPPPEAGGAVIVSNHRSSLEPLFIQALVPRAHHWMIARKYVEHALIGWPLRQAGAIPVNRAGIDTAATKLAIRYAQSGEVVGMFPEGRINATDEFMLPGRPGAAMVALRSRVPIIPCYIEGAPYGKGALSPFLMPAIVRLTVGEPIDLSPYYDRDRDDGVLEEVTRLLMRRIAHLAGRDDFEPKIAGRKWLPEGD